MDKGYTAPEGLTNGDDFCGIPPFETNNHDPFTAACAWHDNQYVFFKLHGGEKLRSSIDAEFLRKMLILNESRGRGLLGSIQAYTYYGLARVIGWIPWYLNRSNGV